jgi:hypothetical protein
MVESRDAQAMDAVMGKNSFQTKERGILMKRAGWMMTGLLVLFMLGASATPKFLNLPAAIDSMAVLGWSPDYLWLLGVLEVLFTLLFVIPQTSLLGAILLTGLFGGAMAAHLRVGNLLFSHTLFTIYLGAFMWLSLWLRDARLRTYLAALMQNKA